MKQSFSAVLSLITMGLTTLLGWAVEPTWNYAVQVSAAVQASPPQISLSWPQDTTAIPPSYTVYRKAPGATSWGTGTSLPGTTTSYTDTSVSVGTAYEYQVVKAASGYNGYGYIQTGINVPLVESRGEVVLIVDNTYASQLSAELDRLQQDLAGDGWTVIRHDVGRNDSVVNVKNLIKADYNADPANVKSVFLFGHVPVPYSGLLNPDGHSDHYGAWPADVYYGDVDGNWTDGSVNYTQTVNTDPADAARLTNVPGDGKFDQTTIPSAVELQVGRVDLANMPGRLTWGGPPTFPNEQELLRQYLNKDHNFRHKLLNVQRRALLGDYFGVRNGEAFAASGFRSFAPLVGANNIANLNVIYNDQKGKWIPELASNDFLLAYGCGAGSYWTIGGLGNTGQYNDGSTTEVVGNNAHAVFTLLFGSWLGDWDHEDNIMRSILATRDYGLASAWSGRPHWFMHHAGLGETIGYSARATQNNTGLYRTQIDSSANQIHVALMGDPTLRLHPVAPPGTLGGTAIAGSITLTWTPSPDSPLGYHVYRATSAAGPFTRVTSSLLAATTFVDTSAPSGATYMVRTVKLETTPSGSYYNASQGLFWTTGGTPTPTLDTTPPTVSVSSPANNATVSGSSVIVSANAADNVGVVGVQFKLDGANLGAEDLIAPYSATWNTTSTANGPHTLTAVARDLAGNQTTASTISVTVSNGTASTVVWFDDALPADAGPGSGGGDSWNWVSSNPAPFSGTAAHQSSIGAGLHEHYFNWASATLPVNTGDTLFTYVYLDPANPPSELMLSWNADNWEHRPYWGANNITYGTDGTPSRRYMGPLPAAGQWVRLEVPASQVGLEGQTLTGMGFSLFDGRATWDYTGKSSQSAPPPPPTLPTVTVTATDANAAEAGQDPAVFTFTRTGSTASALTVNYDLADTATKWNDYRRWEGDMPVSITIPAGAASATLTVYPVDDTEVEGTENVILTILSDAAYTVGSQSSATATITDNDSGSTLPVVTVTATDASAAEAGLNPGVFTVTRTGGTTAALTVNFALSGTANSSDYNALSATVTLPIGLASSTVVVTPIDDSAVEGSETVVLTLSSNAAYTVGSPNSATVTIADNDTTTPPPVTNAPPSASAVDYTDLTLPKPGDHTLHILSPTLLEVRQINTKNPDPARVDSWDFVNASGQFVPPALTEFAVTVDGLPAVVQSIGFKRRPLYAPLAQRDLRIDNCLYLQLATPIADNQTVEVKNPTALLWPSSAQYVAKADPLRYSPAIHVNQEGYVPSFSKKAMVGYYLGSLGEMNNSASLGFKIVDANTGAQVYQGQLSARLDIGYVYSPTPYQKVLQADFSNFTTPGEYRLVVPGLGASLPFMIDDGVAMGFTRTYALGLYHQRCGASNVLPYTRFTHNICHAAQAEIPSPQSSYSFTWTTIASKNSDYASNPRHTAPQLKDETSQLYPFVNKGTVDVSGGHHDAGDYSKYTINSAALVHRLMFTADSIPGGAALDNLGLPESGDGISDVMQEAKWEADFIAKMQDADGGFYFIVYPKTREYESNVTPDNGDTQVVWPKNTAVTAASVAALAQCASSPRFKQAYPAAAASYLQKAKLGWQFLMNAIAAHGKDGAYQKVTFYGDHYMHDDELAWAAAEMYLATGEAQYQQKLLEWFPDPSDPNTFMWGWWRMSESWGNAIRSYAFAARSGRLTASQLNAGYLAKCEAQITAAGDDALRWSQQSAYGSAFPEETKHVRSAGWYFSLDQASDMAVADVINPRPEYVDALVGNMNYEGGCNPVNVTYLTGLGWKRPREIVHQYAQNDRRVLPQSGIPQGNIQASFDYLYYYGAELGNLNFPSDGATASPYPFYDRWADSFNVTTEFVSVNQTRSLMALALLASQTSAQSTPWTSASAQIVAPTTVVPVNEPVTLTLQAPGLDLSTARIVWEARDQEPAYGSTYTISPKNNGAQWVEAEMQWPDGRRVFATSTFNANSPTVTWVDEALPAGAQPASEGGDGWNWIMAGPTAFSGTKAHQSNLAAGQHGHWFDAATATLQIDSGDTMFAYVYLDPANVPSEVMLMWNDGDWEHRAYWGANNISYGSNGTVSRRYMDALPAAGQWARLEVPASQVGLEGSIVKGMAFYAFDGRATWDAAGKTSQTNTPPPPTLPTVTVSTSDANASEPGTDTGTFTVARTGSTTSALTVNYTLSGTAVNGTDYNALGTSVTIPAGAASVTVTLTPKDDTTVEGSETAILTLAANAAYTVGPANSATINIADNDSNPPPPTLPTVTVVATDASASEAGPNPGVFTIARTGSTASALTVNYTLGGTASNGTDYNTLSTSVTIPADAASATVTVVPKPDTLNENTETVLLTLVANASYTVGLPNNATVNIANARRIKKQSTSGATDTDGDGVSDVDELVAGTDPNDAQSVLKVSSITKATASGISVSWPTVAGKIYRVSYAESVTDEYWTDISEDVAGNGATASWTDTDAGSSFMRIYVVTLVN